MPTVTILLDQLIHFINDRYTDEILQNYVTKEFSIPNKNNIIESYSN